MQVLQDLPIAEDPSADDRHYWKIAAFCVTGFFVIIFLLTCVLIRRIRIAIACIKVSNPPPSPPPPPPPPPPPHTHTHTHTHTGTVTPAWVSYGKTAIELHAY